MMCSRLTPSLLVPCVLVSFSTSLQKVQICLVKISWWAKMGANVNRQNAASILVGHQIMDFAKEHGDILCDELELCEMRLKAFEEYYILTWNF